jgi:predicted nucleic acid-binding protein
VAAYYFDTSALVKRYVAEVGSGWVTDLLDPANANAINMVSLTTVEVVASIARRERGGALAPNLATSALTHFRAALSGQYIVAEALPALISSAISLAERHGLRGSDAIQLAAALQIAARCAAQGEVLTLISADGELNAAAVAEGLAFDDPNLHP